MIESQDDWTGFALERFDSFIDLFYFYSLDFSVVEKSNFLICMQIVWINKLKSAWPISELNSFLKRWNSSINVKRYKKMRR